jgi:cell division protein FtsB
MEKPLNWKQFFSEIMTGLANDVVKLNKSSNQLSDRIGNLELKLNDIEAKLDELLKAAEYIARK